MPVSGFWLLVSGCAAGAFEPETGNQKPGTGNRQLYQLLALRYDFSARWKNFRLA